MGFFKNINAEIPMYYDRETRDIMGTNIGELFYWVHVINKHSCKEATVKDLVERVSDEGNICTGCVFSKTGRCPASLCNDCIYISRGRWVIDPDSIQIKL